MQLFPRRQPGRIDRKAAAYAAEIKRLRAAGYTYEAIREALADVGIELSESALRREVRRRDKATVVRRAPPSDRGPPQQAEGSPSLSPATRMTSRELAESFFEAHPSNPLLRTKDHS